MNQLKKRGPPPSPPARIVRRFRVAPDQILDIVHILISVTIFSVISLDRLDHIIEAYIQGMRRNVDGTVEKSMIDSLENTTEQVTLL
ncbi:MAG: hypothetical protein QM730_04020 [Anaerolineales bacterium]